MNPKQKKDQIDKEIIFVKRLQSLLFTIMITFSSITIILPTSPVAGEVGWVPIDYPTIQDALDDPACSVIEVLPGIYEENLSIVRPVILYGLEGPDDTILDVPGALTGIKIKASDVLVRGFKIDGGEIGIQVAPDPSGDALSNISLELLEVLSSSDNGIVYSNAGGTIKDSWIHDNSGNGLKLENVTGLNVSASIFSSNGYAAMAISDSEEMYITANLIEGHAIAWRLERVDNAVINQNLVEGTAGIELADGSGNVFEENIMELDAFAFHFEQGIHTTELNDITGNIIETIDAGGTAIDLIEANGNLVNDNVIVGPWETGLSLIDVRIGDFEGNVISGPSTGVMIDRGDDLVFEGNVIMDGTSYGVRVNDSDNVEVVGNVIVGSNLGLVTTGEVLNLLVDGNVFSENDIAVRVEGPARTTSVRHNVVDSNVLGVDFFNTTEGDVTHNIVTENTDAGIQVRVSDDVLIANNEIVVGGLAGIRILDSGSSPEALIVEANNFSTEVPQPSRDPGGGCPTPDYRLYGIEVQRSNLTLQDNLLENIIHEETWQQCDSGYGIYVKASEDVHILRNIVDGYQKYGILVEEEPNYALLPGEAQEIPIKNNTVLGLGEKFSPSQIGIMVRGGANASLEGNLVKYNWYESTDDLAIGIGVFEAPYGVNVLQNTVEENQYGIYLSGFENSLIDSNSAIGNVQGIRVENAGGTIITSNEALGPIPIEYGYIGPLPSVGINITDSPNVKAMSNFVINHSAGIKAKISDDILIKLNDVTESNVSGIYLLGGTGALVEENYVANGEDGIIIEKGATYAVVTNNLVEGNARGIIVNSSDGSHIMWNEIRNGSYVGILLENDRATYVYRNIITDHGNGIESFRSLAIYVDKNDVIENVMHGVYLDSVDGVVKRNEIKDNGVGLNISGNGNDLIVAHNNVEKNEVGVDIVAESGFVSIEFNQIARNTHEGVHIGVEGEENTVFRNIIKFNDGTGIKVEGDKNALSRNVVNNNGYYGIWATNTSQVNIFKHNVVKSNTPYDAKDDGNGNQWIKNQIGIWDPDP